MTTSPIKSKYKRIQDFLDAFFLSEIEGAKKGASDIRQIKRTTIFFNFVQKHGTYQSGVFNAFCEWIKEGEFFDV